MNDHTKKMIYGLYVDTERMNEDNYVGTIRRMDDVIGLMADEQLSEEYKEFVKAVTNRFRAFVINYNNRNKDNDFFNDFAKANDELNITAKKETEE